MFTREITGLTLTNQVANDLFVNIRGDRFGRDESFLATLRALMHKRIPEGESIYLQVNSSCYSAGNIHDARPDNCVRAYLRSSRILSGDSGIINIHTFQGSEEDNEAALSILDKGITGLGSGYSALTDVDQWIEQYAKAKARVFINEKLKNVAIFISALDVKRWHLLQSLLPRYFPWYIKDQTLDDEEIALLRSLTKRYAPEYENLIQAFGKRFDFRSQMVRRQLDGFETRFEREKLQDVRRSIESTRQAIANLESSFSTYFRQLNDLTTQELGLVEKIKNYSGEDSELLEYFLCNKGLDIVYVSKGTIEFIVKTTLSNYDPDLFESIIAKKGRSFFYRHYQHNTSYGNTEMTDERIERLMKAVFRDETLKLRVCAAYRLNFSDGTYEGLRGYSFPADVIRDHTPNQHIQHYACLGNNGPHIRKAMNNRDYVSAISSCCASATNINFSESNTGTFFMEKIFATDVGEIIQMPDGSTKTPLDAVKWLEEIEVKKLAKKTEKETHDE